MKPRTTETFYTAEGLTKREYFAAMALQGYLAGNYEAAEEELAHDAVRCADALIAALNERRDA